VFARHRGQFRASRITERLALRQYPFTKMESAMSLAGPRQTRDRRHRDHREGG
jgi:hypothetical protein